MKRYDEKLVARAWQRMTSGRRLDILDPSPLEIEIEDIARGLSRIARWNGQTAGDHPFSVAQHSILVAELAAVAVPGLPAKALLAALLHDAAEYVTGDLVTPFKRFIGPAYRNVEERVSRAIRIAFGLPALLPAEWAAAIDRADHAAAFLEGVHLAGFGVEEARGIFDFRQEMPDVRLEPWDAATGQRQFLAVFSDLTADGVACRKRWQGVAARSCA